jgi:hypothetical protein
VNTTALAPDPGVALALGLAVFPLDGRRPTVPGWAAAATRSTEVVREWPAHWNPGIGCRTNDLVVLDVDQRPGIDGSSALAALWETAGNELPPTLTVRTASGGRHLYFRAPVGWWIASGRLVPGVDVRAPGRSSGGYVVGPGAVVDGRRYSVDGDVVPIADLPDWLVGLLPGRRVGDGGR